MEIAEGERMTRQIQPTTQVNRKKECFDIGYD